MGTEKRRTKRRYASEIYPHAGEWELRPLSVEVPHRYAEMVGTATWGTGWFDLASTYPKGSPEASIAAQLTIGRIIHHLLSAEVASLADALSQGLTGDEAWSWAMSRVTDDMELAYERAAHYGIPFEQIKPYPCGPEPDRHDHRGDPAPGGGRYVTQVDGKESECPDCTEPATETQDGEQ